MRYLFEIYINDTNSCICAVTDALQYYKKDKTVKIQLMLNPMC